MTTQKPITEYDTHAASRVRKASGAEKWAGLASRYKELGNMSALADEQGVTRKTLYDWKRQYEGQRSYQENSRVLSTPRGWGRRRIQSARRLISKLPISVSCATCSLCNGTGIVIDVGPCNQCEGSGNVERALFTAGDIVVLLALIAGDRDALDQLPELLREPMSKCLPSTR